MIENAVCIHSGSDISAVFRCDDAEQFQKRV